MVCRQKQAPRVTGSGQSLIQFFDVDKEGWGRLCVCAQGPPAGSQGEIPGTLCGVQVRVNEGGAVQVAPSPELPG